MTLREQAITAMYAADGERVGERVFVEKALDGLLVWLRSEAETGDPIDQATMTHMTVPQLCDLLEGET